MSDPELPVRVQAASSLKNFVRIKKTKEVRPGGSTGALGINLVSQIHPLRLFAAVILLFVLHCTLMPNELCYTFEFCLDRLNGKVLITFLPPSAHHPLTYALHCVRSA